MSDKQLGLGQYKLFQITSVDKVPSGEEVEYLLETNSPLDERTVQQKIANVEQPLTDEETRYLLDPERQVDYESLEQTTLETGATVETEITDYDAPVIASD